MDCAVAGGTHRSELPGCKRIQYDNEAVAIKQISGLFDFLRFDQRETLYPSILFEVAALLLKGRGVPIAPAEII